MSDSTIDDALRLLESGKGNADRLKQIIETFETRSLISLQDRKYVEALVQQYLTPRHRIKIKKIEPVKKEPTNFPRTLKSTKPEFSFKEEDIDSEKTDTKESDVGISLKKICPECGYENSAGNNFCNSCGTLLTIPESVTKQTEVYDAPGNETSFEKYEREYIERLNNDSDIPVKESDEEKSTEYIEAKPNTSKKINKKFVGIAIGVIAVIIIGGGAAVLSNDNSFFSTSEVEERITCDNKPILVSSTKIPGFPDPEKDLQYYLDRYSNEPNYKDWFDRNFPDQTIKGVLVAQTSDSVSTKIPGFPDPEKDLQYYLDRNNNEPNYKDWFDRNFRDQTIKQVVC